MRIAVLGGTGPEGQGIAVRLALAGEEVVIGSRAAERAAETAKGLREKVPSGKIGGATNAEAAAQCEVVFIVVPYEGLDAIFSTCTDGMAGKVVVDTVVPLKVEKGFFTTEPVAEGSAGERIQARVPSAKVVSAFKHQSAHELMAVDHAVEGDVILCGNDAEAKSLVAGLASRIRDLRPIDVGDLRNARILEPMTALLLNINKKHKTRSSFRILGV
jgi:hypothetical protein